MRPMAPKLVILHNLRMPVIHVLALRAAYNIGIEHAALDRKPTFGPVLPGMPLHGRRPLDIELAKTGGSRHKHRPMVTDHSLRATPLRERLSQDLNDPAEIVPLAAARPHHRTTVSIKNQHTIEPVPGNLDEISEIDEPDLVWGRRRPGAFRWVGD